MYSINVVMQHKADNRKKNRLFPTLTNNNTDLRFLENVFLGLCKKSNVDHHIPSLSKLSEFCGYSTLPYTH